jgi:hypothetical protein
VNIHQEDQFEIIHENSVTGSRGSYHREGLVRNADGSYDVYFGPVPPEGWENNWIQTIPNKGWNMLFRLYGPLDPWFDKTWKPGEPELVE